MFIGESEVMAIEPPCSQVVDEWHQQHRMLNCVVVLCTHLIQLLIEIIHPVGKVLLGLVQA